MKYRQNQTDVNKTGKNKCFLEMFQYRSKNILRLERIYVLF